MKQKETPKSPMSGGKGAEVSKTLFYIVYNKFVASVRRHNICKANIVRFVPLFLYDYSIFRINTIG